MHWGSWMRRLLFTLGLWMAAMFALGAAPASAGKRVALVIGNSGYEAAPRLANPSNDARDFARLLTRAGFESVDVRTDVKAQEFRQALRDFTRLASDADVAVFYFAGHGIEVGNSNLLVPIDARLRTDLDAEDETVSVERVMRALEPARKLRLVILDACRDNPFLPQMQRVATSRSIGRGLQRIEGAPADTMIAFSTEPGSVADDGNGSNSPFTKALIDDIASPGLDIRIALGQVRDDVMKATGGRQRPFVTGSIGGSVQALVPRDGDLAAISPPPPPRGEADASAGTDFKFAQALNSPAGWTAFLGLHPEGDLADKARQKLVLLTPPSEVVPKSDARVPDSVPATLSAPLTSPTPPPVLSGRKGTLRIGVAGPMTGANAVFGAQMKTGAQQAVDDLNARGGILGNTVVLEVGDDEASPKQGIAVATALASHGIKFVVGHFNSGVTIPASDVYAANDMVMITPSATNPRVTEGGKWNVFRTCGRDDSQGQVAARYAVDHFRGKGVAIVHDQTTYGKGLADAFKASLNSMGVREVLYEGVVTGERDYSAVVAKIRASGARLVYWGGLHPEGGLIRRQMTDQGATAVMMSGDGITDDEFATIAGPGAEGTLMTSGPDPRKNAAAAAVVKELNDKRSDPQQYTLYSYAAVQTLAEAAEMARSTEPKEVARVMHGGRTFFTVLGWLSFNKKGDRTGADYVMYTWRRQNDGKITYVQNE